MCQKALQTSSTCLQNFTLIMLPGPHSLSLIRHVMSANGATDDWFQTSCFIVDSFHFKHHHNEPRCQEFCNPAPTNGSQPNLVHPVQIPNGQVCYRQAFNTEAAEQLNVWLHKYSGQLSHMHPYHHDFLLQVMFTHHF